MAKKIKYIVVKIECHDSQTHIEACERLKRWIECYGHSSPSFGFNFQEVIG